MTEVQLSRPFLRSRAGTLSPARVTLKSWKIQIQDRPPFFPAGRGPLSPRKRSGFLLSVGAFSFAPEELF